MITSKFCWISLCAAILLAVGCNAHDEGNSSQKTVNDSLDTGSIAIVHLGNDSISGPTDSIPEVRQDSPKKSLRELAEERRLAQKPRTFSNIGAPDDRLPSIKNFEKAPECKAFYDMIRRKWNASTKAGVFQVREDSIGGFGKELSSGHKWLRYIPQADIETLFGKPSRVSQNQMTYYMNDVCLGRGEANGAGCEYLKVELTHDKLAVKVSVVSNSQKP
jgi:hypothetical protein